MTGGSGPSYVDDVWATPGAMFGGKPPRGMPAGSSLATLTSANKPVMDPAIDLIAGP